MPVRPIRLFPDEVLRVRCPEVESFDEELARLAADMVETMHAAPGVGLAAPQVGVELRVMVVDLSVGEDPEALRIFVNPRIVEQEGSVSDFEGCLSIPNLSEKVERPQRVRVEAQDLQGRPFTVEAEDWLARAVCHETDHLDGVLFIDHLRGLRREKVRRQLRKMLEETPA
ncbi:MAG TPA: peptide deformylase [Thermoanaerobaculia bacterium]|nr:peptide deformylase [Thermoanaerobaculia bacterium]